MLTSTKTVPWWTGVPLHCPWFWDKLPPDPPWPWSWWSSYWRWMNSFSHSVHDPTCLVLWIKKTPRVLWLTDFGCGIALNIQVRQHKRQNTRERKKEVTSSWHFTVKEQHHAHLACIWLEDSDTCFALLCSLCCVGGRLSYSAFSGKLCWPPRCPEPSDGLDYTDIW